MFEKPRSRRANLPPMGVQKIQHVEKVEVGFDSVAAECDVLPHSGDRRLRPGLAATIAKENRSALLLETIAALDKTLERCLLSGNLVGFTDEQNLTRI